MAVWVLWMMMMCYKPRLVGAMCRTRHVAAERSRVGDHQLVNKVLRGRRRMLRTSRARRPSQLPLRAAAELSALRMDLGHCLYAHLFLANMGHFQAANAVYCKCGGAWGREPGWQGSRVATGRVAGKACAGRVLDKEIGDREIGRMTARRVARPDSGLQEGGRGACAVRRQQGGT